MIKQNLKKIVYPAFSEINNNPLSKDKDGFTLLAELLHDLVGINLPQNDKNLSLMSARLWPILRDLEFTNYSQYLNYLKSAGENELNEFISRMTTNTTQFFREEAHFNLLRENILPQLKIKAQKESREIRVWCAACSTGQEAYTLAMILAESLGLNNNLPFQILATDIDQKVLDKAYSGIYSKEDVESVPGLFRMKYFSQQNNSKKDYKVISQLKSTIDFGEFNLTSNEYPFESVFDIVFCRNVLIYFQNTLAQKVLSKLVKTLGPHGHLFIGHSESGIIKDKNIRVISNAVYQKVG